MASAKRTAELRASVRSQLDAAVPHATADSGTRLRWLYAELENQLDRWLAFAAIESIPLESLRRDDLFATITVLVEAFEHEPGATECEPWRHFQAAWNQVGVTKSRASLPALKAGLAVVGRWLRA